MRKNIWIWGVLALTMPALAAEKKPPSWEFFFLYGLDFRGARAAYANSYDPHPGYHIPGSYARQTLNLDPAAGQGIALGVAHFFSGGFGVRLMARRRIIPLGGENTPYEYFYRYTSIYPPYYIPEEAYTFREMDWVPTEGSLGVTSIDLEAALRLPVAAGVAAVLFAGPSLHFAGGHFSPLGFTEEWLGGHGIPMREDYLVYIKLPAEQKIGFEAGVELSVRLSGGFSAVFRAAYSYAGKMTFAPEIDEVYYYSRLQPAPGDKTALVKSRFDLQPLTISLSTAVLGAGLKFGF
ncbi:MAG: hypothetical protein OEW18_05515 [Candidatus Aminicenantes bacterium]|nr:hypothetical protein [Candidatus Aminicenantes bacterium]